MTNLIRSDIYKLFRAKSLYICTLVSIAFIILSLFMYQLMYNVTNYLVESTEWNEQSTTSSMSSDVEESMDADIQNDQHDNEATFDDNDLLKSIVPDLSGIYMLQDSFTNAPLFLGIFLAMFITSEFSNHTIKNIVSRGFSRRSIYLSKLIMAVIANIFLIVMTSMSALIAGTIMWKFGTTGDNFILNLLRMLSLELLVNIAVSSIFVMISFIIKRNGPAIAVNLVIVNLSSMIFELINLLFDKVFKSDFRITDYWVLNCISELSSLNLEQNVITRGILVSFGTIIVASAIGMFVFEKRDIN